MVSSLDSTVTLNMEAQADEVGAILSCFIGIVRGVCTPRGKSAMTAPPGRLQPHAMRAVHVSLCTAVTDVCAA